MSENIEAFRTKTYNNFTPALTIAPLVVDILVHQVRGERKTDEKE